MVEKVIIGDCELWHGDCREILPHLPECDAVITDPPYSERTHAGHDTGSRPGKDDADRKGLGYKALTPEDIEFFAGEYTRICTGWVVWMTDHTLAPMIGKALEKYGRYVFAPLPFYAPGRSVRLTGDGPCSWTDWIVVARTKAQLRWGTLPGGYVAGPGWNNDKARMGGKPVMLMDALVAHYTRQGQTVLDTHMGAGTTGVSCVNAGRSFIGCEIEREPFDIACRRIEQAYSQPRLFQEEKPTPENIALFD